jgi:hypothetical protein
MSRTAKLHWLVSCCYLLLAGLLFSATIGADRISSPASSVVSLAVFVSLGGYLLLPGAYDLAASAVNSLGGALLLLILLQLPPTAGLPPMSMLRLCIVVFCLGMLLYSATQLLESIRPDSDNPRVTLLLLTAIIAASPLWLGPVVEIYQPGNALINGVVSISPLTHFSVALEYDYLRGDWMYRHSPFGSLPFAYPGYYAVIGGYLLSVSILRIIIWRVTRHARASNPGHIAGKNYN